jgi:acetyltransferase-like isoleucine patch superfamily enzyme
MNHNEEGIRIEDDCWIGAGAIILNGVTVGKGSIVGAGSVVTKNVDPYSVVVVGNPAKKIKEITLEK